MQFQFLPTLQFGQINDEDAIMNSTIVRYERRLSGRETFITVTDMLNEIDALGVLVPWKFIVRKISEGDTLNYGNAWYRKAYPHEFQ